MTTMIEVKVAELSGKALDWAVAQAEGIPVKFNQPDDMWPLHTSELMSNVPRYSTDWSQGGTLIDKHKIEFAFVRGKLGAFITSSAYERDDPDAFGPDHLVAAMRAIVAAKLGDTVSVPAELVGGV